MNGRTPVPLRASARRPFSPVGGRHPVEAARWLLGLVVVLLVALGLGSAAGAAPAPQTLVSSSPQNGAILESAPARIVLTFAADIGDTSTFDLSCAAEPVALGDIEFGDDGRSMSTDLDGVAVGAGACSVRWSTVDRSGVPSGDGIVTFSIENAAVTATTVAAGDTTGATVPAVAPTTVDGDGSGGDTAGAAVDDGEVDALSRTTVGDGSVWMSRLLSSVGIALLFGALVAIALAWPEGVEYLVTVRFVRAVWFLALIGTYLFTSAAAGSVTGDGFGAGLNPGTWTELLGSDWAGRVALVRMVLVVTCAWVAFRPDRVLDPVTQLAALGIPALTTATIGVSRTLGELAVLNVVLGVVHALAMAVWFGGTVLVARVVLAGPGEEDLVHAVRGFSRISIVAIVVTIASGVGLMIRLDGGALLDAGHGRLIVVKAVVVAAMIFLAVSARQFVGQRLSRAHEMSIPLADRLRRAFGAEAGIGTVTMVLSAWLIALAPPNVDTTPTIDYDIATEFVDTQTGLDVALRLTDARVGTPAGLEVRLRGPAVGVTSLAVDFLAPPNAAGVGGLSQPVPLTAPGTAVRSQPVGLPFAVPGEWQVQIRAVVNGVPTTIAPKTLNVVQSDGTQATTLVTLPASSVVTVPVEVGE